MKITREDVIAYAITVPLFVALVILSVFIVAREESHNRELVQFEALRIATEIFPLIERPDFEELLNERPEVLGFGLYAPDGLAWVHSGTAPEQLLLKDPPGRAGNFRYDGRSLVLVRRLGDFLPMMRGMPGRGPMSGRARAFPKAGPVAPAARTVFLEIDLHEEWRGRQDLLRAGVFVLPASFIVLFFVLMALYHRLRRYQTGEERQRVLVQLGEASRTLAHEIRNPLGAIRVRVGLLKKALPPEHARNLELIDEEVDRLNLLVNRIGEFLKNPRGNPEALELSIFVREIIDRLPHPVGFAGPPGPLRVLVDPQRLRVVIENLLRNAAESLPAGPAAPDDILVGLESNRKSVILRVSDRGRGLPEGGQERLFDPFFTTKERGSGIGLAVSRRFVEAAGGSLELAARPDGGSQALVTLPAMDKL